MVSQGNGQKTTYPLCGSKGFFLTWCGKIPQLYFASHPLGSQHSYPENERGVAIALIVIILPTIVGNKHEKSLRAVKPILTPKKVEGKERYSVSVTVTWKRGNK